MSFGWKPPIQRPGEVIPAHALNKAYAAIGSLLRITVGRGLLLSWVNGSPSIQLEGDFACYDIKTTDVWPARASGSEQMGKGHFKFRLASLSGLLSDAGLPAFEGWNYTGGSVPANVRGIVVKISGTWRLISADCSGLP